MSLKIFVLLVVLLSISTSSQAADAAPKSLMVVLLGGQSNADGRAVGENLPINLQSPQTNVVFYWHTHGLAANPDGTVGTLGVLHPGCTQMPKGGFGPEITLGYNLSRAIQPQPGEQLAIIKYAKGGSSLSADWKAGGDASITGDGPHYQIFQRVVKDGLESLHKAFPTSHIKIMGMVWVQGESDIDGGKKVVDSYAANFTLFIKDVRQTFGADLPFFFSRVSAQQTICSAPTAAKHESYLILHKTQESLVSSVTNVYMIDTDSHGFSVKMDCLHFDANGQQMLGKAFAEEIAKVEHLSASK